MLAAPRHAARHRPARRLVRDALMAKLHNLKPRITAAPARIATMTPGAWRADKTSSTARGYGYKWQQAGAAYLVKHPSVYSLRQE